MAELRQACRANPPCRRHIDIAARQSLDGIRVASSAVEDETAIPRIPDRRNPIEAERAIDGMERQTRPTLQDAQTRLTVSSTSNSYTITVFSNRDGANTASFVLARASGGTTSRTCTTTGVDKGGCSGATGTW